MTHTDIINKIIELNNYTSYLEIGVYDGNNYNKIKAQHKACCEPKCCIANPNCAITYEMTSDEMFTVMSDDEKYDIIFIDGMHDESFVDRDIMNSMKHLNENGCICLHDTYPQSEDATKKYDTYADNRGSWNGDVYKSIIKLHNTNLQYHTIKDDFGLTIIKKGVIDCDLTQLTCEYTYKELFTTNLCDELLHTITIEKLNTIFDK